MSCSNFENCFLTFISPRYFPCLNYGTILFCTFDFNLCSTEVQLIQNESKEEEKKACLAHLCFVCPFEYKMY